jgi:dynein regulatory complex subunit 2
LSLGELSSPFQTDEEKIVPFANPELGLQPAVSTAVAQSRVAQNAVGLLQASVWAPSSTSRIVPADRLSNFHRRVNKITLDTVALTKEKERLDSENAKLQDLITQYVNGTRIDDRILQQDNTLFVVNGR